MQLEKAVSWLLPNRTLSNEKTRSAPAEFGAMAKAIRAASSLHAPTSEIGLFHQLRMPLAAAI